MKKNLLATLIFGALLVSGSAMAADGLINMSGTLVGSTCKINGVTQTGSTVSTLSFDLGKLPVSTFSAAGIAGPTVTNSTSGQVALTACPVTSPVTLVVNAGTGGLSTVDLTNNGFKNTATTAAATGVISQLIDAETGNVLNVAQTTGISKTTDSTGAATFKLGSRFYSTAAATAGAFTATATFNIIYQ
jgi:major type 1 subunit fimbrin (pilin)